MVREDEVTEMFEKYAIRCMLVRICFQLSSFKVQSFTQDILAGDFLI